MNYLMMSFLPKSLIIVIRYDAKLTIITKKTWIDFSAKITVLLHPSDSRSATHFRKSQGIPDSSD